jgi:hypothetical protein
MQDWFYYLPVFTKWLLCARNYTRSEISDTCQNFCLQEPHLLIEEAKKLNSTIQDMKRICKVTSYSLSSTFLVTTGS